LEIFRLFLDDRMMKLQNVTFFLKYVCTVSTTASVKVVKLSAWFLVAFSFHGLESFCGLQELALNENSERLLLNHIWFWGGLFMTMGPTSFSSLRPAIYAV